MFSPMYRGRLTNHLPMVLAVLKRVNVPEVRIEEVKEKYINSRKLDQAESTDVGRRFLQLRNQHSKTDIKAFLENKEDTIPSGLFHHFIRLYFSLGNKEEETSALAYFDIQSRKHKFKFTRTTNIYNSLEKLKKKRQLVDFVYPKPSTMDKFEVIMQSELSRYFTEVDEIDIKELLNLFLHMYEQTRSFYVLHVLTGFQAVIGLREYLDLDVYLKEFYKCAQIYYVFDGYFDYKFTASIPIEEGISRVGELEDAHDIKLMYSLSKLAEIDHNPLIDKIVAYILKG